VSILNETDSLGNGVEVPELGVGKEVRTDR